MGDVIVLSVGEDYRVAGLLQGSITYAGMPNDNVYSVVHKKEIGGHYAYNLFYPRCVRKFAIVGVNFFVEDVTPQEIAFRIEQTTVRTIGHRVLTAAHA